jgi:hypothetical protein
MEYALTEEGKFSLPEHHSFNELELVHFALNQTLPHISGRVLSSDRTLGGDHFSLGSCGLNDIFPDTTRGFLLCDPVSWLCLPCLSLYHFRCCLIARLLRYRHVAIRTFPSLVAASYCRRRGVGLLGDGTDAHPTVQKRPDDIVDLPFGCLAQCLRRPIDERAILRNGLHMFHLTRVSLVQPRIGQQSDGLLSQMSQRIGLFALEHRETLMELLRQLMERCAGRLRYQCGYGFTHLHGFQLRCSSRIFTTQAMTHPDYTGLPIWHERSGERCQQPS